MKRYNAGLVERSRRFETAKAILLEWRDGRGPCYVDCTHLPGEKISHIRSALPLVMAAIEGQGKDLAKDKVEYQPTPEGILHTGGIRIKDVNGTVDMKRLWVVGAAGDYCGGVESTYASALSASGVQAYRAGARAAEYVVNAKPVKGDAELESRLKKYLAQPLSMKDGLSPDELLRDILTVAGRYINLIANDERLRKAASEIDRMKSKFLGKLSANTPHKLMKAHEAVNMLLALEASAKSQLARKESRACLVREDYPEPDSLEWMKWTVTKLVDGDIHVELEAIPMQQWQYTPPKRM